MAYLAAWLAHSRACPMFFAALPAARPANHYAGEAGPRALPGLIDPVPRVTSSSHRRYAAETVDTLEALACLRSTGMGIDDMRAYLNGVAEGLTAAPRMVALFAAHAGRLERELAALRVRQAYTAAKVALWRARVEGDRAAEQKAAAEVLRIMGQLRDHDKETHR